MSRIKEVMGVITLGGTEKGVKTRTDRVTIKLDNTATRLTLCAGNLSLQVPYHEVKKLAK